VASPRRAVSRGRIAGYVVAQVAGGIAGALVLYLIASGKADFSTPALRSNGFGEHSPGGYSLGAALVAEVVLTAMFLIVILEQRQGRSGGIRTIAIGLALTLIHLISIPVTNTSVNPARSTAWRSSPAAGPSSNSAVLGRSHHWRRPRRHHP